MKIKFSKVIKMHIPLIFYYHRQRGKPSDPCILHVKVVGERKKRYRTLKDERLVQINAGVIIGNQI